MIVNEIGMRPLITVSGASSVPARNRHIAAQELQPTLPPPSGALAAATVPSSSSYDFKGVRHETHKINGSNRDGSN